MKRSRVVVERKMKKKGKKEDVKLSITNLPKQSTSSEFSECREIDLSLGLQTNRTASVWYFESFFFVFVSVLLTVLLSKKVQKRTHEKQLTKDLQNYLLTTFKSKPNYAFDKQPVFFRGNDIVYFDFSDSIFTHH